MKEEKIILLLSPTSGPHARTYCLISSFLKHYKKILLSIHRIGVLFSHRASGYSIFAVLPTGASIFNFNFPILAFCLIFQFYHNAHIFKRQRHWAWKEPIIHLISIVFVRLRCSWWNVNEQGTEVVNVGKGNLKGWFRFK